MKIKIFFAALVLSTGAWAQHRSGVEWTTTDWMGLLPDNALVCQLSFPGTHDTASDEGWTGFVGVIGGDLMSKTQDVTVSEQYNGGVRAFDIRPSLYNKELYNSHGATRLKLKVEDMLDDMVTFLDQHPTEFFVFHIYKGGDWDAPAFSQLLNKEKYQGRLVQFRNTLTVGEMRGKMLFLSRHDHEGNPWPGGYFRNWNEMGYHDYRGCYINAGGTDDYSRNEGSSTLYVQDFSSPSGDGDVDLEMECMVELLDYSTHHTVTSEDEAVWVYNFASGCALSGLAGSDGYRLNATYTNKRMLDYLTADDYEPGPTGVILMDYALVHMVKFGISSNAKNGTTVYGDDLVTELIDNNFRCKKSQLVLQRRGDVNLDGFVDVADVTTLVNIILGNPPEDYGVTDINGDSEVDVADVTSLVNLILSKE